MASRKQKTEIRRLSEVLANVDTIDTATLVGEGYQVYMLRQLAKAIVAEADRIEAKPITAAQSSK